MPLEEENRATRACIELSVRGTLGDKAVLQKRFMELSNESIFRSRRTTSSAAADA